MKIHFDSINSTSLYIKEHVQELEDMTFVDAYYQSEGKGRHDREWLSNKGENLLFSLLIKDQLLVNQYNHISLLSAVSIYEVLISLGVKNVSIKWPNDVYIANSKVAGILLNGSIPNYLVIGIGINVNQNKFLGTYRIEPTSIRNALGKEVDLNSIKEMVYSRLITNLEKLKKNDKSYQNIAQKHNYLLGKTKSIVVNNEEITGEVIGLDDNDFLLLKVADQILVINSGEIKE